MSSRSDLAPLFESVIGNPRALAQNKRFTEADLNRVAPGDAQSALYEVRRASELVTLFKKFDHIIDFHETKANDRIVIIIPRLNRESLALALSFNIDEIIIWPSSTPNATTGPLVQHAPFGIEIECGTKSSFELTLANLEGIITKFLESGVSHLQGNFSLPPTDLTGRKFYLVYGQIDPHEVEGVDLKDHEEVDIKGEKFTALLFGKHQGLTGYKMRILEGREILEMVLTTTHFTDVI